MRKKKNILVHLVSLSILCLGFLLCRYVFFEIHGMKQWPGLLFGVGLVSVAISFFLKGKTAPIVTSLAYTVSFAVGVIFATDGVDAGGARTNNLWIIWTLVFVCLIVAGAISEKIVGSIHSSHK